MAAYVPQHAARDANRYPVPRPTLGSEPRKLSQSAVTAVTAYLPSTTSPNSDGNSAHSTQSVVVKPTKKLHKTSSIFSLREKTEKVPAYVPKHAAADFTKQMAPPTIKTPIESPAVDLDHPLLRKVGLLPPGAPQLPQTPEKPSSDYENYLDECRVTATRTTLRKPPVKLINIEKANRLSVTSSSTNSYSNCTSPRSPSAASFSSTSTAPPRRGSLMSKVADYIKPGSGGNSPLGSPTNGSFARRESTFSQMSFGSISSPDPNDARIGSRRGSVMSSMSSRFSSSNNHNKNRRMSSKESDAVAIEKAVIESYKNARQHTKLPVSPRIDEISTFENFGQPQAGVSA